MTYQEWAKHNDDNFYPNPESDNQSIPKPFIGEYKVLTEILWRYLTCTENYPKKNPYLRISTLVLQDEDLKPDVCSGSQRIE